ncbi:hypothetical protein PBRA_003825 [Plasmodiophora brassicae]|uniref:FERM domain-containing protein n=1 Tax=Plasmodiophora brassicae TaxID=37360 RepID=A0A0G4IIQ8_PLABS|nr:hypothetical protein PBRA_003825 [Plasmodiophora brassicae]
MGVARGTSVLKVLFPAGSSADKCAAVIQYEEGSLVRDVLDIVAQKYGGERSDDWGLFDVNESCGAGQWLDPESIMPKQQGPVHYQSKIRQCIVTDIDNSLRKTVLLNETSTVAELTATIAKRFGIDDSSEFSLQKHQHLQLVWLVPEQPLYLQVPADQVIVFRKKFFVSDSLVGVEQPSLLHVLYLEARHAIITGAHPLSFELAVQFAAMNMQITYGNYDPLVHVAGFMDVMEFLPPPYRSAAFIEEYVYREHRRLRGADELVVKHRFIRRCKHLPTYGATFSLAREQYSDEGLTADILLGANCNAVLCLNRTTKEIVGRNLLVEINAVDLEGACLTLRLKGRDREFILDTVPDARLLHDLIVGYKYFQRTKAAQKTPPILTASSFLAGAHPTPAAAADRD